ncbi:putative ankyrin repeat protein RF_0381 [Pecten maximus]|uniref:putative ankyrin repeat protein RF_0381 n=1 Tax=Pecten maximus TaxID=6579 RepID=UPI00145915AB|nr:putative ankyrin repeat protein RF_0381 [Pecten maximus]
MTHKTNDTLLFDAIFSGDKVKVMELVGFGLDKNSVLHCPARWEGATVLGAAACLGHIEIAQYLLEEGAPVNFTDPCTGRSALHWAIIGDQYQMAKLLIKNGADTNIVDKESITPLLRATIGRNYDLTKLLLKNGADVNRKDALQCSALHYACVHGDPTLVDLVIKGGCILNNKAVIGKGTPLASLIHHNDTESITLLIDAGYDLSNENWLKNHMSLNFNANIITQMLVQSQQNPSTLRTYCRNVIRKQMGGRNVQKKINTLNIPPVLKSCLLLQN